MNSGYRLIGSPILLDAHTLTVEYQILKANYRGLRQALSFHKILSKNNNHCKLFNIFY